VLGYKGRISPADADARAKAEYEEFAARRRAMPEAEAEREQQVALEDTAKNYFMANLNAILQGYWGRYWNGVLSVHATPLHPRLLA
jgi:hypothetical protein